MGVKAVSSFPLLISGKEHAQLPGSSHMIARKFWFFSLIFSALFLGSLPLSAQARNLTVAVLVNSQNSIGYNTSPASPGEFQRSAERYLQHLQVPYEVFDVSSVSPPADLS